MISIAHLTSAHQRYDIRIFLKECRSLKKNGYKISLVVADGNGDENKENISIFDVGKPNGRIDRMRRITQQVFEKAKQLNVEVYHIHDPELIPTGLKLKRLGKKVIFDAHEDLSKQLLGKPYLNKPALWSLSKLVSLYERWACRKLDGIVTATPYIRDKFKAINANTVDINNYPMLGELAAGNIDWSAKKNQVCYIGGIARTRGIQEVVHAMAHVTADVRLQLGGIFSEAHIESLCKHDDGWERVDALGFISRLDVRSVLQHSVAGLVTFYPEPNHIDAQPNKMFEYMSAGIPVIGSNFSLWQEIIEYNRCGICVDPLSPKAIAEAIDYLIQHPSEAEQMGRNGQAAVLESYNWSNEEIKLVAFYKKIGEKQHAL